MRIHSHIPSVENAATKKRNQNNTNTPFSSMDEPLMDDGFADDRPELEMADVTASATSGSFTTPVSFVRSKGNRLPSGGPGFADMTPLSRTASPQQVNTVHRPMKQIARPYELKDPETSESSVAALLSCCGSGFMTMFTFVLTLLVLVFFIIIVVFIIIMFVDISRIEEGSSEGSSDTFSRLDTIEDAVGDTHTAVKNVQTTFQKLFVHDRVYWVLPRQYAVSPVGITPVKTSGDYDWLYSIISWLEASYRSNGVAKGFLNETEYVRFSEQALGRALINFCKTGGYRSNPYCNATSLSNGTLDSASSEIYPLLLMHYKDDPDSENILASLTTGALFPESICPTDHRHPTHCPGMDEAAHSSPLEYSVSPPAQISPPSDSPNVYFMGNLSIDYALNKETIKGKLWFHQSTGFFHCQLLKQSYLVPCHNDVSGRSEFVHACEECIFPCDYSSDGCCFEILLPAYDDRGVFFLHGYPSLDRRFSQTLVGYNDDLKIATSELSIDGIAEDTSVGGFILKNSLGWENGHSIGYWLDQYTDKQEESICPCPNSPTNWDAIDPRCVGNGPLSSVSPLTVAECQNGFTLLECTNFGTYGADLFGLPLCDQDRYYAVALFDFNATDWKDLPKTLWVIPDSEGSESVHIKFYSFEKSNPNGTMTEFLTNSTTLDAIPHVFNNAGTQTGSGISPPLKNNPDMCGFYFMPYDVFDQVISRHGNAWTSWAVVDWHDSSYFNIPHRGSHYNYTTLVESTKTQQFVAFSSPLDVPIYV